MEDIEIVIQKVRAARAAHKAKLTGIERMKFNLEEKLRGWMLREDGYRCVCISEIVEKIVKYAPKTILGNRQLMSEMVENIWSITHSYRIDSEDFLREDLEYELSNYQ